jgi:hypothetical protein
VALPLTAFWARGSDATCIRAGGQTLTRPPIEQFVSRSLPHSPVGRHAAAGDPGPSIGSSTGPGWPLMRQWTRVPAPARACPAVSDATSEECRRFAALLLPMFASRSHAYGGGQRRLAKPLQIKPSSGLEPETPSLPSRSGTGSAGKSGSPRPRRSRKPKGSARNE